MIEEGLTKLIEYIEKENYRGWDPYDGLKSPLLKLPVLKTNQKIRFAIQQLVKRSPINIRPLLFVPKGYNPVTLGLCIQAYSYLHASKNSNAADYLQKIDFLISELKKLIPEGYSGACWGYDFDWAARRANIPAYQPTVVATGIITNSLFECYRLTGNETALELCKSAAAFVLNDLKRTYSGETFCFSYSPFDTQQVYNASMKGARLLGQVYSVTKQEKLKDEAKKAVEYVINKQNADGSWFYANNKSSEWIDNYHTGYILDCLDEYIKCTGDNIWKQNLENGLEYYTDSFFEDGYKPKFYNKSLYPIDCTAAGQSLLTLIRFGRIEQAIKVAEFTLQKKQHTKGYFYFRKHRWYVQKTSFMRWSNAWMMAGLSYLEYKENQNIKQ